MFHSKEINTHMVNNNNNNNNNYNIRIFSYIYILFCVFYILISLF